MNSLINSPSLPNLTTRTDDHEGGLNLAAVLETIRRRALLVASITAAVAGAAVLKALTDTPIYQGRFEILTEPVTVETQVISSVTDTLSSDRQPEETLDATKTRLLKSPILLSPLVERLQSKYPDISYETINSNLTVEIIEPNLLNISFQNSNPELVEDVLDLLAEQYLEYSLNERRTDILQGADFVDAQLPMLRSRVESLQTQLQGIRQQYNLVDPEIKGEQLSAQLKDVEAQKLSTQVELDVAENLYSNLQQELSQQPVEAVSATALKENPRYQNILTQVKEIDSQIAKQSVFFLENSREMGILREQRQNLLSLLQAETQQANRELASRLQELRARRQALVENTERLNLQMKQLSEVLRRYTDVQRELEIATNNLNQFVVKREALQIDAAQREIPWKLLLSPTEPQASSSSLGQNLAMGTVLGLLLGVGAAMMLEKLSNILHSQKEIKEVTQLPLLGTIPFDKSLQRPPAEPNFVLADQGQELSYGTSPQPLGSPSVVEAFRSLYTNIRLLNPDAPIRSLVISSAVPGEGKSTVAVNLARAAASMGQQVLLVNSDLRNSGRATPQKMQIKGGPGLTDLISGIRPDAEHFFQKVHPQKNLFFLASGPMPPDPGALLASEKMRNFMEEMRNTFDLVIYDAPPITGLSDVNLLAPHTDGVLLVTNLGQLKRSTLEQALEELKITVTPIIGTVANQAQDPNPKWNPSHLDRIPANVG